MPCVFKNEEGQVCGAPTNIDPRTTEPYKYCRRCFIENRRRRNERFSQNVSREMNRRLCRWVGNHPDEHFPIRCMEAPIHRGWCRIHKEYGNKMPNKIDSNNHNDASNSSDGSLDLPNSRSKKEPFETQGVKSRKIFDRPPSVPTSDSDEQNELEDGDDISIENNIETKETKKAGRAAIKHGLPKKEKLTAKSPKNKKPSKFEYESEFEEIDQFEESLGTEGTNGIKNATGTKETKKTKEPKGIKGTKETKKTKRATEIKETKKTKELKDSKMKSNKKK